MALEYHARRRGGRAAARAAVLVGGLVGGMTAGAHPGARPGESSTFRFSIGGVESGRARMSVGRPSSDASGRRKIAVHGQAETTSIIKVFAHIDDDYQLLVDGETLLPREVTTVEKGVRERRIAATFEPDGRTVALEVQAKERHIKSRLRAPQQVRDPLSAYFALRALPLTNGDLLHLDVLDGAALLRVQLRVGREPLRLTGDTSRTERAAIRMDAETHRIDGAGRPFGSQPPRHLIVWLSDDADRTLLRMDSDTDFGRASIELTSYQRGARGPTPALPGITVSRTP